jgi:hypothetical protein
MPIILTLKKAHGHRRGAESEKWVRVFCGILGEQFINLKLVTIGKD